MNSGDENEERVASDTGIQDFESYTFLIKVIDILSRPGWHYKYVVVL